MSLSNVVKDWLPPIVMRAARTLRHHRSKEFYANYQEALSACRDSSAYQMKNIVQVVVEKNDCYRQNIQKNHEFDLGTLRSLIGVALANTNGTTLRVLDFGGGGGYHYAIAKIALGDFVDLHWNVVETSAMTREAQRLSTDQLKFFDNIEAAATDLGEVDLVFTSGALHYCLQPLEFLDRLVAVSARHLFITRTAFNDTDDTVAIVQTSLLSNNGPGALPAGFVDEKVMYPNVLVSRAAAEQCIEQHYDIRFRLNEDQCVYKIGRKDIHMYGYFCDLR